MLKTKDGYAKVIGTSYQGSSDYLLLSNGDSKAISSLSVNYATSAGNADTVDGYHASSLVKFYLSPMANDAPADSAKSWFINTMPSASGAIVYNVPGVEKTIIAGKSSGAYGHMLQLNYQDTYLRVLRYYNGSWKSTDWEKISAGYADSAGSVAWANVTGKPSSLKNPYSLNVFGVTYDGSAVKVVSPSNFISQVNEVTSTVTDGTMFITSWASDSGFADTNAINVPYKRKAIHLWEYIKAKTDSLYTTKVHNHDDRYLKLTGGTMQLGEGLKFHADENYFGTDLDARIISLLDGNDKVCDGGLIIDERATLDGKEYVTELLRIRDSEFKWKGSNILHSGNSNINGNTITINGSSLTVSKSDHTHSIYAVNENYGGFTKLGRLPISGFYQSNESKSGGNAPWSSWVHLINCQHSTTSNNYALQIAASFFDNNTFKIRVTNNSVNNAWRDIIHSGNIGSQLVKGAYMTPLTLDTQKLISSGYLASDYTNRNDTVEYMKAAAKYLQKNYPGYSVFGTMVPNVTGFFTANIYTHGFNSNGNPEHITIHYYPHGGNIINCGTTYGSWYYYAINRDGSSYKLQTARKIWGQSFDGTADISGTLSGVAHIQFSADNTYNIGSNSAASKYIYTYWLGSKSGQKLELGANNSGYGQGLCIDTNLNVGIGTNTPAYKLDVKGDIRATGQIIRESSGQTWVNGRRGALLREITSTGYHTLWSLKTTNGSWDFGEYNSSGWNNIPVLSYITDTNFNSSNNTTTYQIKFPLDSGTIALTKNIPTSLKNPYSLTLKANGTTLATYDGSVSKIVNLTYDNVGAAAKNHTHNSLEPWASYITGDSHATALKSIFDKNKTSIPRNKFISMLSSAYANTSYYMGYFLYGYENAPYGGFFVAHYDTAYYIGISNGSFAQHRLVYSTDIPNSLKNPHALTISLNGTSQGPYDGSAAKSINITPSSIGAATSNHTHSWTSITDKLVAGNEFNIVNAGFNSDMWFNHLPINDRSKTATISNYCFGNGNGGYATVTALGFAKNGSSSSYVLLGDGGHKTISSLSVNHANSADNAATATHASFADYICSGTLPTPANNTVKAYKDSLAKFFKDIRPNGGVGANVNVSESIISNWSNDSATYHDSSTYCFIKIGGAYAGATYGQFLLSSYNLSKVGIVGRNSSQWSKIKWLAYEDQIPTDNNQLANGAGYITSAGSCAYANSAGSVAWNSITGKPSSFTPSAHTHSWDSITGKPSSFTPSAHDHNYVLDIGNNVHTTFAYSKPGLSKDSITWLAVWNGYELRAMNKDQIALSGHTHDDRYLKLTGGTMTGTIRFNNLINIDSAIVLDYKYSAGGFARDIVSMKNSVYGDANLGALSILCYPNSTSNGFQYIYLGTDKYDGPNNLRIYKDKVTFGDNILIDAGNIGSQSVAYASKAGNADKLDGYHASYDNNTPWGTIPVITTSGYMDIGKHLEFHRDNTTGSDYSTILMCTGNYSNIVNLPSESGTLALTKDVLIFSNESADYLSANFNNPDFSKKAASKYIECWDNAGGWWNWMAGKFMKAGSSDAYVLLGGGGHKPLSEFQLGSGSYLPYNGWWASGSGQDVNDANGMIFAYATHKNTPFSSAWGIITTFDYTYNSAYKFQLAANGYSNAMYYRSRSNDRGGWTSWAQVIDTGNISSQTVDKSYHLRVNHSVSTNSTWSTWYWIGQSGQPTWLWGTNDGINCYVWNPSNFSVAKSEYSRSLLGRSTSGSDYDTNSSNLVFAEWNTMNDSRWYLKATDYECRVDYANSAGSVSNSLNIFGVSYNGSAAKTVTTSTFVSQLSEGTSTVTDGTMFITSYASDSGFADTNAVNVPYKRKASCLWNYIDNKVSSKYLPLAGGTMNGNARIGHGSGNLYIGNSGNDGWIYTQDIASQLGTDKWYIRESGAANFGNVYICTKSDYATYDSSIIECYNDALYLNYYSPRGINLCNGGGTVQIGSYTSGDTGNNKLYVNGSEFINGASNVKDHVFANGFRHRSHNSDDAVLLAGGGYSQGVPVRYWAIYYMYIGNSSTDITYTKRSGNYDFITSEAWESEGSARFDISFPSGYNKNNTLIFGNGDHRTSSSWKTSVYVTITTSTAFGTASQIRVMISDDANLNVGFANIYFMCMG